MNTYIGKMIAPIIIIFLLIGYSVCVSIILIKLPLPQFAQIIIIGASVILSIALIFVLYTRIKEIRSGEEDDLSKY